MNTAPLTISVFILAATGVGLATSGTAQPAPSRSASVVSSDGVLEFTTNPAEGTLTVRDLLNKLTMSETLVCPNPRGAVLTKDEVSLLVVCRGSGEVAYVNTAHFDVVARVPGLGKDPAGIALTGDGRFATIAGASGLTQNVLDIAARRLADAAGATAKEATQPASRPKKKNQLAFIGTIHGEHRTSQLFSVDVLRRLITAIRPDYVLTEIPPNRLDRASREFAFDGRIAEPRVSRFPEYVDVLFALSKPLGLKIVGTAGWTQPMDRYRRTRLAAIERDPTRAADWAAYQSAIKASDAALAAGGASDDPRWIHTDAYDAAQRLQLDVYNRLFDHELGTGGWDTINKAHFANLERTLNEHTGEGVRFLVTYGAGHKSWMLRRLRERADLEVLEMSTFLDQAGVERSKSR